MRRFNFLPAVVALLLMVTVVSCTTIQETYDDEGYYSNTRRPNTPNRIYVDDPYQGTIVLERDLNTGRYYQLNPIWDNRFGYSPYFYGSAFDRGFYNGYRNGGRFHGGNVRQAPIRQPQPSAEQRRENERQGQEARKRILGNNQ